MDNRSRNFSAALIVLCALLASASASAQAAPYFHVEAAPAIITGEGTTWQVLLTESGSAECEVTYTGLTNVTTTTTQELTPKYTNCTAFSFFGATMNMNGCKYLLHLVEGSFPPTATMDIVCPQGAGITIAVPFCTVTIPPQTGLGHIWFLNTGTKTSRDVDAEWEVGGIEYKAHEGCSNPGTFSDGELFGEATLKADTTTGKQEGYWVE
jgi:hypothetical protein